MTINSASEESFLNTREANRYIYGSYSGWWIGYNDQDSEGSWYWAYGSSRYTNWSPGEPNNGGGSGEQACAVDYYYYDGYGRWGDESCDALNPFICERGALTTKKEGSFTYSKSRTYDATVNTTNRSVYLYAGQLFTVGTCGVYTSTATGDTYLRLNDPYGNEIAEDDESCGHKSNISIVVPVTGTYVIRAGCYSTTSCSGTVAWTTDYY